jgi:hypothetical protein
MTKQSFTRSHCYNFTFLTIVKYIETYLDSKQHTDSCQETQLRDTDLNQNFESVRYICAFLKNTIKHEMLSGNHF